MTLILTRPESLLKIGQTSNFQSMLSTFDCGGTIVVESEFDKNLDAKSHLVTAKKRVYTTYLFNIDLDQENQLNIKAQFQCFVKRCNI